MKMLFRNFACCALVALVSVSAEAGDARAYGDVLGRDLKVTYPFSRLGHVGMWYNGNVLEALDTFPALRKNSMSSFKSSHRNYWGLAMGYMRRGQNSVGTED